MGKSIKAQWNAIRREYADDIKAIISSSKGGEASVSTISAKTGYSKNSVANFVDRNFENHEVTKVKRYVNIDDSADIMEVTTREMYATKEKYGVTYR